MSGLSAHERGLLDQLQSQLREEDPEWAGQFIDFLLGKAFQEDMPLNMYVYPVLPDAALPDAFTKYAVVPTAPLSMSPKDIADNRDRWIDEWTNVVLR